ncbi:hypothetical protein ASD62_03405 [Phycicoccus sp. Root563]|uniref:hypothetical protein n=1 Tax=Phycicoccus sp. Root563 TaxID=1736562 RepID=UPI000702EE90|nr:hypothetical protein [Phycicoccus sp. Root563]KQZ88505.1 hypothetical protein ASD62_03405 [Phycicoccus sp. Root563]
MNENTFHNWQAIKPARPIIKRKRSVLNGHMLPTCASGRIRYRDRSQAQDAIVGLRRTFSKAKLERVEVVAWHCPTCQGWHLRNSARLHAEVGA